METTTTVATVTTSPAATHPTTTPTIKSTTSIPSGRKSFNIIVASTQKRAIGKDGNIPWRLKSDLRFFKKITTEIPEGCEGKMNAVILGRKTWESIPSKFRPLPGRLNVVLTKQATVKESLKSLDNVCASSSFSEAIDLVNARTDIAQVFVIGGSGVYAEALESTHCKIIYHTLILKDFEGCDTFFPPVDPSIYRLDSIGEVKFENDLPYQFNMYHRKNEITSTTTTMTNSVNTKKRKIEESGINQENDTKHEEHQYLNLIADIIKTGNRKGDRTGVGTWSKFGKQMRFNLRESFPLLTTKRVFWRGVVEELLWLIKGSTDSKELSKKKVKIWDANGTREFLDNLGFSNREIGDLGPIYGFQWRHFGASYVDCKTDYNGKGIDQLKKVINTIKNNPTDRRIIMSAWNVSDIKKMALPPCHVLVQFYVANGELSSQMYQRSCDLGLGVPFNIASYSLLTCMLAQVCGLKPGDFVHCLGDAHVYTNHVDALKEQLKRTPRPFPTLKINPDITDIEAFTYADLELVDYKPHKRIKMKMAV